MANAPLSGETGEAVGLICPTLEAKYFSLEGWTVDSALIAFWKFDFWRNDFFVFRHSGAARRAEPGIHGTIRLLGEMDSGFDADASPRNDRTSIDAAAPGHDILWTSLPWCSEFEVPVSVAAGSS